MGLQRTKLSEMEFDRTVKLSPDTANDLLVFRSPYHMVWRLFIA